jgi:chromate reductase, NAD(P)H dehydrogenase (quinone)
MYTIISTTNRVGSNTLKIAKNYQQYLQEMGVEAKLLDLQLLTSTHRSPEFVALEKEYLLDAQKFILILPEYNGSMPGIFKLMIDQCDIKNVWWGKKVMMTGIASGRAGNNRGMDHLTNIFNYLKVNVFYNKIPLSQIETEISGDGQFAKEATIDLVKKQIEGFLAF